MKNHKSAHLHLHIKYFEETKFYDHVRDFRRVTKYRCDCGDEHVFWEKEEGQISMPNSAKIG